MKIEKARPTFNPIAFTITIESLEEFDAIYMMSLNVDTIPELVDAEHSGEVKNFISALHKTLRTVQGL